MFKWLKNKCTECLRAAAPANVKSHLSVLTLNHAPTSILSKLPTLETALIKNVVMGPQAESRTLRIARPLVKRMIIRGRDADKKRLEQVFGRYTKHYLDLGSFLFCSELAEYTNELQSNKQPVIERKNTIAGFLAKKSSDFLRSYILYVNNNEPKNYLPEEDMVIPNYFLYLNFKRIDPRIINIITKGDLGHTHGTAFSRAIKDTIEDVTLKIKRDINDLAEPNSVLDACDNIVSAFNKLARDSRLAQIFPNMHAKLRQHGNTFQTLFLSGYRRAFWFAAKEDIGIYLRKVQSGEISSEQADSMNDLTGYLFLYCRTIKKLMQCEVV
ncbi:MAG: hypothetical protein JNK24_07675 [Alphaproteobacteria bacterium]|nr:hypothetical protein [Alphaproteobacteria bacterium]